MVIFVVKQGTAYELRSSEGSSYVCSSDLACRIIVGLLTLAHDRGCEAELADCIAADLEAERLPDLAVLQARLAPDPACVPQVTIQLASLASYESLLDAVATSAGPVSATTEGDVA